MPPCGPSPQVGACVRLIRNASAIADCMWPSSKPGAGSPPPESRGRTSTGESDQLSHSHRVSQHRSPRPACADPFPYGMRIGTRPSRPRRAGDPCALWQVTRFPTTLAHAYSCGPGPSCGPCRDLLSTYSGESRCAPSGVALRRRQDGPLPETLTRPARTTIRDFDPTPVANSPPSWAGTHGRPAFHAPGSGRHGRLGPSIRPRGGSGRVLPLDRPPQAPRSVAPSPSTSPEPRLRLRPFLRHADRRSGHGAGLCPCRRSARGPCNPCSPTRTHDPQLGRTSPSGGDAAKSAFLNMFRRPIRTPHGLLQAISATPTDTERAHVLTKGSLRRPGGTLQGSRNPVAGMPSGATSTGVATGQSVFVLRGRRAIIGGGGSQSGPQDLCTTNSSTGLGAEDIIHPSVKAQTKPPGVGLYGVA